MIKQYRLIDPDAIYENLMNNTDLIRQFLQLYQTQIPTDFAALKTAVERKDFQDISSRAHHIKPTMEYIGATALRTDLQKLETAAKEQTDMTELDLLFKDLDDKFETLLQEIERFTNSLS